MKQTSLHDNKGPMVSAGVGGPKNARTAIARVFLVVQVRRSDILDQY